MQHTITGCVMIRDHSTKNNVLPQLFGFVSHLSHSIYNSLGFKLQDLSEASEKTIAIWKPHFIEDYGEDESGATSVVQWFGRRTSAKRGKDSWDQTSWADIMRTLTILSSHLAWINCQRNRGNVYVTPEKNTMQGPTTYANRWMSATVINLKRID